MLKYQGKDGEYIPHVPARDLTDADIQEMAERWDKTVLQTEALLTKRGLYAEESTAEAASENPAPKRKKGD